MDRRAATSVSPRGSCSRTARSRASVSSPSCCRRRGPVLVEAPTYDRPLKILAALERGGHRRPPGRGAGRAERSARSSTRSRPSRTRPAGRSSMERRKRLAERARDGLLVLEDDPYGLVRFEGKPPPTVFELARRRERRLQLVLLEDGRPGLARRLPRAAERPGRAVEAAAAAAYITPALLSQATVLRVPAPRDSFEPNLERVCGLLRERRDAMIGALERHLPEATWTVPEGGYFVWLELPGRASQAADLRGRRGHLRAGHGLLLPGRAERARSGSPSATSRRRRSRRACGAWPQPSAPRSLLSRAA